MPKLNWNEFVVMYQGASGFSAAVAAKLPVNFVHEKNYKKLPTPYALFLEWASTALSGNWTATKHTAGFTILVELQTDALLVQEKFGMRSQPVKTKLWPSVCMIGYRNESYIELACELGYCFK